MKTPIGSPIKNYLKALKQPTTRQMALIKKFIELHILRDDDFSKPERNTLRPLIEQGIIDKNDAGNRDDVRDYDLSDAAYAIITRKECHSDIYQYFKKHW